MGSNAIIIGAVALATGLVCLLCGYLWGRSNVKAQVEDAVDQARRSFDAREFALREELEEKMVELAQFHARAESLQEPPAQLNLKQVNGSASEGATAEELGNSRRANQKLPGQRQEAAARVIDSTEETIQNLLKSMEERLKQPEEEPRVVTPKSATPDSAKLPDEKPQPLTAQSARPAPAKSPAQEPIAVVQQSARPAPPPSPAVKQPPPPAAKQPSPVKDEWQDFAASLEALTRRTK